jgi:hypothetical protein
MLLGGIAIGAVVAWWPDREIAYSREITIVGCGKAGRNDHCYAWARLSIGNTGNVDQAVVRVRLPGDGWQVHARSADIRASLEPRAEPRLDRIPAPDAAVYEIRPLPRNKVVDLNAYCMACPVEAMGTLDASRIAVESEGRAREGDPRTVTLIGGLVRLATAMIPF